MKKTVYITLLIGATLQAGMMSTMSGILMKDVKPDTSYTLETNGYNPRVYEFTTVSEPRMKCVALFSSSNENSSPTMQCIPLNQKK